MKTLVIQHCDVATPRACFYWSMFTMRELYKQGVRPALQAGSAFWPRVTREAYDANPADNLTHFGFQWDPDSVASAVSESLGQLPEVHIWVGLVETQEILDFSTGYWPQNCLQSIGKGWEGPLPPEFYWGPATNLPDLVHYAPDKKATMYVGNLMERMIRERRI